MKKILQLLIFLFTGYTAIAQDLVYKIPEKAFAVASVKSDQLFQLLPVGEFDTSSLGQKLLGELSKRTSGNYKSIAETGISLSSTVYYYNQQTDSITYHCLLVPLSDTRKFETLLLEEERAAISQQGDVKILQTSGRKNLLAWNNQFLLVATGSLNNYFFNDSAKAAIYGIHNTSYDYSWAGQVPPPPVVDTTMAIEEIEATPMVLDSTEAPVEVEAPVEAEVPVEAPIAADTIATDIPLYESVVEDTAVDPEVLAYNEQQNRKDSLLASWLQVYAKDIFNSNSSASILKNPGYVRSADKNAIASFWMANLHFYRAYLPYYFHKYGNILNGYGSVNARLYLGQENMRITGEMGLEAEKATAYKNIYNKKLNRKFLKYVKSDSLIGFMSYAFDTEAYLRELPGVLSQTYGLYEEELGLASDLLSLMLDEKAVAKVVKGDALILMTNLSSREVSYKTYAYDENYEYRDTVKTKTETLPDILCMFSSDDTRLLEKLFQYGVKKGKVQFANNIYSLAPDNKNPFSLHMLIKDGIVFLGTSFTDIEQIKENTYRGSISKQHEELLMKNNMTLFFSPQHLEARMPVKELEGMSMAAAKLLKNTGNVYVKSSGIRDNYISIDMIADVPRDKGNALKYFLSMVEDASKLK